MPTPANRSKLLPARGSYAALEASLPDLLDGEMVFATDQRVYYQVEAGALVAVNSHATTTTEDVETVEGSTRSSLRDVIPPEIPAGWTDLVNQREVNWWLHREVENVANRTTINEQQLRDQAERIYDLENVEPPVIPEVDLSGYATTKELDAANVKISGNTTEIVGLQEGFDAALLAAQEGSENLTIELQSYAKKEDTATKEELAFVDGQYKLADENILKASQQADTALGELIEANTTAIEAIQIPDVPDIDLRETVYSAARVSHLETLVWAGQNQAPPSPDPTGSIGWHYTSAGDGTKAYWTLWSQDRDSHTKLTLADVYSFSLLLSGKGTAPYLQVLTKRKNDGNDAASTYRSKLAFQLSGDLPPAMVSLALLTTADNVPLYANLAHLLMDPDELSTKGPCEDDEEITKVVVSTNSVAKEGEFDFMLSSLVLHTKQGTYDTHLEFTGLTEVPEIPGPDPRLPYVLEQGIVQSGERAIMKDAPVDEIKTRETQELETLTLRDGEGTAMGDIAFECANGIGVRWSSLYAGTLRITGENLQKEIKDGDALLQKGIDANTAAIAAIDTSGEVPDLSSYALKSEIPTDNKELVNGAGYMSAADFFTAGFLNGYATEAWVGQQGYITAADLPEPPPPAGGGATSPINEVLTEGNIADAGQTLRFNIKKGDLPPVTRDQIDVEGGSGLRLGGLVSTYTINEPFTVDTENGTSEFAGSARRITAIDDYMVGMHPKGGQTQASIGMNGVSFYVSNDAKPERRTAFNVGEGQFAISIGDSGNEIFDIDVRAYDGTSSITAGEFIGDGSKLTNLPAAVIDWDSLPELN